MASGARKTIQQVIKSQTRPHWVGDGFNVYPLFNDLAFSERLSPFLMFDYGAPKDFGPTKKKLGVGMHPHRGFETVTIALQGEVEHKDSEGNTGVIGTGDVQWMTAGSGIFHEEFHSRKFAASGGTFEMMQLWVNLPSKLKMTAPRYQPLLAADIPKVDLPDEAGTVAVIAGEYAGVKGAALTDFEDETGAPAGRGHVDVWEIRLNGGQSTDITVADGHTMILFVRSGKLRINDEKELSVPRIALMTREGSTVTLTSTSEEATSVFLLGGEPIDEPIASHGPMVMNTQREIQDAMRWAYEVQSNYRS